MIGGISPDAQWVARAKESLPVKGRCVVQAQ